MKRLLTVTVAVFAAAVVVAFGAWKFGFVGHLQGEGHSGSRSIGGFLSSLVSPQTPQQMAQAPEFAFRRLEIDTTKPQAEACLVFTRDLDATGKTHYEDYFSIDPANRSRPRVVDDRLCLAGFDFNKTYNVTLKTGPAMPPTATS